MSMTIANFSNMTNPVQWLAAANTHSNGQFWPWSLFMFVIILGIALMPTSGAEVAALVALFAGLMIGVFLYYMGLVGLGTVGIIVGALLFLIIYMMATSRQNQ